MNFYEVTLTGVTGEEYVLIVAPSYKVVLSWCNSERSAYGYINFTISEKQSSVYNNDGFFNRVRIVENCPDY